VYNNGEVTDAVIIKSAEYLRSVMVKRIEMEAQEQNGKPCSCFIQPVTFNV
jgi:hypothetical protein